MEVPDEMKKDGITDVVSIKESKTAAVEKDIITKEIRMKGELSRKVEEEKNKVNVTIPVKMPAELAKYVPSASVDDDVSEEEMVTVPATQLKKITTVQKTCPKRVQKLVITELEPIVTTTRKANKEIKEIKTPIRKHVTTTTTVKRTTMVTTETTTIIGNKRDKNGGC